MLVYSRIPRFDVEFLFLRQKVRLGIFGGMDTPKCVVMSFARSIVIIELFCKKICEKVKKGIDFFDVIVYTI